MLMLLFCCFKSLIKNKTTTNTVVVGIYINLKPGGAMLHESRFYRRLLEYLANRVFVNRESKKQQLPQVIELSENKSITVIIRLSPPPPPSNKPPSNILPASVKKDNPLITSS